MRLKKGEKINIEISGLTHSGEGVGRYMGVAVFVPGAVPGDKVIAELTDMKKNYALARLLTVSESSPARRKPRCAVFHSCGGCRLQQLDYREQLRLKTILVKDSLMRIGGLGSVVVKETVGMDNPWNYRNKAHFQLEEVQGRIVLGFYEEGSHSLTPLPEVECERDRGCLLVDSELNEVSLLVEKLINRYIGHGSCGKDRFFHHVMLRKGFFTGEIMVVLVTGAEEWPQQRDFVSDLMSTRPGITSLFRNINDGLTRKVLGNEYRLLAGREYITDRMDDLVFVISPPSFYQVNPVQTRLLYKKALNYAELGDKRDKDVLDAYSGTGTIALYLAGQAKKVYAIEVVSAAVEDARRNSIINGINNVRFYQGEVEKILPSLASGGLHPEVAILDPPRRGCRREVLEAVSVMGVPRVVYVSCDPGTLARDLGHLVWLGYTVEEVQPVDMFPWTHHVETVVLMSRVKE